MEQSLELLLRAEARRQGIAVRVEQAGVGAHQPGHIGDKAGKNINHRKSVQQRPFHI